MKVLITGVTGFVGSTLADYLIDEHNIEVHGIRRPRSREEFVRPEVTYHEGDITDMAVMTKIIRKVKPTHIFHLAAQSFVPLSWQAASATLDVNIIGTLNMLDAICQESPETVLHIAGSSEEYGYVLPEECPISELQPLRPMSPYGVSKVAADMLGQVYYRSYKPKVVITRAFNHTGPRRGEIFVTSKIAKQLAEVKLKMRPPVLRMGNLESIRDFTDVRDTIAAYFLLAKSDCYGEPINIGTGIGYSVKEILKVLQEISGVDVKIEKDPELMRPSDVPRLICDNTKVKTIIDWTPRYSFQETMEDLFNYWLQKLSSQMS